MGQRIYRQVRAGYHWRAAGEALARRDFDGARAHLADCLDVWPDSGETHFLAARAARRGAAYEEAQEHLTRAKHLGWVPEAVSLERALAQAQRGEPALVQGYLLQCVEGDHPDTLLILEALTQGYLTTFDLVAARGCLDRWLERDANAVPALLWRGEVFDRLDRPQEAMTDYRRAVELAPERDDARLRLASLLVRAQMSPEAATHYEQLYRRQPDNPAVLLGLARCRYALGDPDEAARLLDALLELRPRDAEALAERGKLAQHAGQEAEAEGWLRRAVEAAPFEREVVYTYCGLLNKLGRKDEARRWEARLAQIDADMKRMEDVVRAINKDPRDAGLRHEAGLLMLHNGQEKEGLRWLDSALQVDPSHRPTHAALADHFGQAGQADLASHHRRLAGAGLLTPAVPPGR